jgi:hypothetical protein
VALTLDHLQQRDEHWAIVDLVGKGGHIRTVPVPDWVRAELDDWIAAVAIVSPTFVLITRLSLICTWPVESDKKPSWRGGTALSDTSAIVPE